jgi:thioredoxin-like negative regulator of GroEL
MNQQLAELLYEGAVALQQGDKQRGLELLMQVVEADETIEEAWLWLSGAVDDPGDQRTALENVLALNPNNQHARYGLQLLDQQGT